MTIEFVTEVTVDDVEQAPDSVVQALAESAVNFARRERKRENRRKRAQRIRREHR